MASVAAGNWGVPVAVDGFNYGIASGMAPRSRYDFCSSFSSLLLTKTSSIDL